MFIKMSNFPFYRRLDPEQVRDAIRIEIPTANDDIADLERRRGPYVVAC
jgi:hypothetical protein